MRESARTIDEAELRRRAPGPPEPPDSSPWEFLLREDPEGAWPLVSRLLTDQDPIVRARALEFVMTWRDERTLPRLLEVAAQPKLFSEQIVDGVRLRERLQHAVANRALGKDAPAIAKILISLVDDHEPSIAAAPVIGAHDPELAAQLAARSSEAWGRSAAAAVGLYRRDDVAAFVAANPRFKADAESAMVRDDGKARKIAAKIGLPGPK